MRDLVGRCALVVLSMIGLSVGCVVLAVSGTGAVVQLPEAAGSVDEGRDLFDAYCASCHGTQGDGNGPAAASMRRRPPNITGLAQANGGVFPAERVRRIVDGREIESHGNREMPVWGDAFKATKGGRGEGAVRDRIASIVRYLASIQSQKA